VAVNLWAPSIQSSVFTSFFIVVAILFDTTSLVILSIVISGIILLKGYKTQSLLLLGAMGGDALLVSVIKDLDQVARPANGIMLSSSFSYPSGHSAGIIVFAGLFAYFTWRHWQGVRSKALIGAGMGVATGIVGFDRIYLNTHWLSDVLGGWMFGAFWLSFVILVFRQLKFKGLFESERFSRIANWLYVLAVVVAVIIVVRAFV
jgi:undecaprenyl-diphosphatase